MDRIWFGLGALAGLGGVAMAAVAAHLKIDPAAALAVPAQGATALAQASWVSRFRQSRRFTMQTIQKDRGNEGGTQRGECAGAGANG